MREIQERRNGKRRNLPHFKTNDGYISGLRSLVFKNARFRLSTTLLAFPRQSPRQLHRKASFHWFDHWIPVLRVLKMILYANLHPSYDLCGMRPCGAQRSINLLTYWFSLHDLESLDEEDPHVKCTRSVNPLHGWNSAPTIGRRSCNKNQ